MPPETATRTPDPALEKMKAALEAAGIQAEDLFLYRKSAEAEDGQQVVDAEEFEDLYGTDAVEVFDPVEVQHKGASISARVFVVKTSEADKKAQADRSKTYGIAVKEGGSATVPKKWKDKGASFTDFADPVNCRYYLADADHVRNALARWAQNKSAYSADEQAAIEKRLIAAAKKFGIDTELATKDAHADSTDAGATDPDGQKAGKPPMVDCPNADCAGKVPKGAGKCPTCGKDISDKWDEGSKSAGAENVKTKQGSFDDNLEEAQDQLRLSGVNAIMSAFLQTIAPDWGELLEMSADTWTSTTAALKAALDDWYTRTMDADDTGGYITAMAEARMVGQSIEKQYWKIGQRNRGSDSDRLRGIVALAKTNLGEDVDEDHVSSLKRAAGVTSKEAGADNLPPGTQAKGASTGITGLTVTEVESLHAKAARADTLESELASVKEESERHKTEADTLRDTNVRLQKDVSILRGRGAARPDPLAGDGAAATDDATTQSDPLDQRHRYESLTTQGYLARQRHHRR